MVEFDAGEPLTDARCELGEGPIWWGDRLAYIDIVGKAAHIFDPASGEDRRIALPEMPGAIVPRQGGGWMLASQRGYARFDDAAGDFQLVAEVEASLPRTRFNDGKCDPSGRFWAGTMDMEEREGIGSLYMFAPGAAPRPMLGGITVSNGICWSGDGRTMYYIDSPTREVSAFDFDPGSGALSNRRSVVRFGDGDGFPDGMTVDAAGRLWVAHWGGWRVTCFDPAFGARLAQVNVPAEKVTACWFGGTALADLYVTTARVGLGAEERERQPYAGALFRVQVGATGLPAVPFAG